MGNIFYHRQNWEKALQAYEQAINLSPSKSAFIAIKALYCAGLVATMKLNKLA